MKCFLSRKDVQTYDFIVLYKCDMWHVGLDHIIEPETWSAYVIQFGFFDELHEYNFNSDFCQEVFSFLLSRFTCFTNLVLSLSSGYRAF